jgi:serine/threonine protein kinase
MCISVSFIIVTFIFFTYIIIITDVYDGFITTHPRLLCIVMPYCEGGDLNLIIKNTKKIKSFIPEEKILKWIFQIGVAIHFLHENGIIHRYV